MRRELCGAFSIEFEDAETDGDLDPDIFVSEVDATAQINTFQVLKTYDPRFLNKIMFVKYRLSLVNYPKRTVSHVFTV